MTSLGHKKLTAGLMGGAILLGAGPAHADVSAESAYVFNTFSFLIHGVLVMLHPCTPIQH